MAMVIWLVSYKITNNSLAHSGGKCAIVQPRKGARSLGMIKGARTEWISPSAVAESQQPLQLGRNQSGSKTGVP